MRMLKISWTDRDTNQRVPKRMGKEIGLKNIKTRNSEHVGHIMRNSHNTPVYITRKELWGEEEYLGRRISAIGIITSNDLFRALCNSNNIANMISNIQKGWELIEEVR